MSKMLKEIEKDKILDQISYTKFLHEEDEKSLEKCVKKKENLEKIGIIAIVISILVVCIPLYPAAYGFIKNLITDSRAFDSLIQFWLTSKTATCISFFGTILYATSFVLEEIARNNYMEKDIEVLIRRLEDEEAILSDLFDKSEEL